MTTIVVEVEKKEIFPTPKAKKNNYIYLAVVGALIVISILVPPPFGSISGVVLGIAGLIYGIILRKKARKENPKNDIAKTGIWLSILWTLLNFFVFIIAAVIVIIVGFAANLLSSFFA